MRRYVLLLRGINVSGKNVLPMKDLVAMLEGMGATEVSTYIQSGNAVFRASQAVSAGVASDLPAQIGRHYGFQPLALVLPLEDIRRAMERNPFPEAESEPTSLHIGFLAHAPRHPDLERLGAIKIASERFHLDGKVFYLHAPAGIGRSKLAAGSERLLGVPMTARNWRTVCRLIDMAGA